jgi:hypothetical protein
MSSSELSTTSTPVSMISASTAPIVRAPPTKKKSKKAISNPQLQKGPNFRKTRAKSTGGYTVRHSDDNSVVLGSPSTAFSSLLFRLDCLFKGLSILKPASPLFPATVIQNLHSANKGHKNCGPLALVNVFAPYQKRFTMTLEFIASKILIEEGKPEDDRKLINGETVEMDYRFIFTLMCLYIQLLVVLGAVKHLTDKDHHYISIDLTLGVMYDSSLSGIVYELNLRALET